MNNILVIPVLVLILTVGLDPAYAQNEPIPEWIKGVVVFWAEGSITDLEFIEALQFLIESGIISVDHNLPVPVSPVPVAPVPVAPVPVAPVPVSPVPVAPVLIVPVSGSAFPGCKLSACYSPSVTIVNVGDVIIFSNTDSAAHTFTSSDGNANPSGEFDTGLSMPGDSFEYSPNSPGVVSYFCIVHPWMQGKIIIDDALVSTVSDNNATKYTYYDNGDLKSIMKYFDNGNLSRVTEYYDNGNLKSGIGYYENGDVKSVAEYYENGNIVYDNYYDENGNRINADRYDEN